MPDKRIQTWQARGRRFVIDGRALFVVDTGGEDKPVLLILHGYPTSSHDYAGVLDTLAEHFRVIVHDHLGFGLSDKPKEYSYALVDQTDVAVKVWQHLHVIKAHVFAHDYGTSIATELLALANAGVCPIDLTSITLCNGSVHIELARLRFIQILLRNRVAGTLIGAPVGTFVFFRQRHLNGQCRPELSQPEECEANYNNPAKLGLLAGTVAGLGAAPWAPSSGG